MHRERDVRRARLARAAHPAHRDPARARGPQPARRPARRTPRRPSARCLARSRRSRAVAAELVEITRRGSLVVGAEVPLSDLSTQLAQRWADRLGRPQPGADRGRRGRPDPDLHARPGRARHRPAARRRRTPRAPARCGSSSTPRPGGHLRITVSVRGPDAGEPTSTARPWTG